VPTRTFSREFMQEVAHCRVGYPVIWDDGKYPTAHAVMNELEGTSRWSTHHRLIFEVDGKTYESFYRQGATEQQDEAPYENDFDEIECIQVEPYERTVIAYRPVK
jgi:hypothetical protein